MSRTSTNAVPAPGSAEAIARGCRCPVIDNHHGIGRPTLNGRVYVIVAGCPLHAAGSPVGEPANA